MSSFSGNNSTTLVVATGEGTNTLAYAYAIADTPDMYASFVNSSSQSMSAPSTTFNIATNGGFTSIAFFRFTGVAGVSNVQRVYDFGNGQNLQNLVAYRLNDRLSFFNATSSTTGEQVSSSNTIVQDQWVLFTIRYTSSTNLVQLYENGTLVGSATFTSIPNRTLANNYIARSNWTSSGEPTSNIDIKGLVVYDRSLTDAEITLCTDILTGTTGGSLLPPVNLKYIITARTLRYANNSSIATWGSFSQATGANQPVFINPSLNHVSFLRTTNQFMSAPSTTFNISTNGGFTAVARVRFTGTAGTNERIFDFAVGAGDNTMFACRIGTTTAIQFTINNGNVPATEITVSSSVGAIVLNDWALFTFRYTKSTNTMQIYKDGSLLASINTAPAFANRTLGLNYIGRPNWLSDSYSNIDIMGLVVYDRSLTDAEIGLCARVVQNEYGANVLPATPVYTLLAKPLLLFTGQPVSTWGVFTQPTTANQPIYKRSLLNWIGLGSSIFSTYAHDAKFARNRWVAAGTGSANTLAYSSDGIAWTGLGKTIFDTVAIGLANNSTTWVAAGSLNNSLANSSDGINWNPLGCILLDTGFGVAYNTRATQWLTVGNPAFKPPYVSFSRASSQFLNADSYGGIPFNIQSNGGFTVMVYGRFTGVVGNYERFLDFSNGAGNDNILFGRQSTSTQLSFYLLNGATQYVVSAGTITQNTWTLFTGRYTASTGTMQLYQDGTLVGTTSSVPTITNRTLSQVYIGRTVFPGNDYLNGDIIGMVAFDRSLSDTEISYCESILKWRIPPSSIPYGAVVTLFPQYFTGVSASTKVVYWDGMVSYTASSIFSSDWAAQRAFDGSTGTGWHCAEPPTPVYDGSTGIYTGSVQTLVSGLNIPGEWLQIRLPIEQRVQVSTISITPRADANLYLYRSPNTFTLAGSDDGSSWVALASFSGINWASSAAQTFTVSSQIPVRFLRLITQVVGNSDQTTFRSSVQIMEWKINSVYPSYLFTNYTTSNQPTLQYETSALNSLRTNMAYSVSTDANVWTYNGLSPFTNTQAVYAIETATLSVPDLVSNGLIANFNPRDTSCYIGSGRGMLSVVGSVNTTPGLVSSGLIAYFNPNNPTSYSGSGATLTSLVGSTVGTLSGTYSYSNGTIRLTNTSATPTSNVSRLDLTSLGNIRTISLWVYIHSKNAPWRYLLDGRIGTSNGFIYSNGVGTDWAGSVYYTENGNVYPLTSANMTAFLETTGVWKQLTIISNSTFTDDLTFFAAYGGSEGLDCSFGPILIYNRVLTRAEQIQNFYAPEHAFLASLMTLYSPNVALYQQPFLGLTADTSNGYIASASSVQSTFSPFYAFDLKSEDYTSSNYNFWHCADPRYNSTTGAYTGAVSTTVSGSPVLGEWLQIQLPYAIVLKSFIITPRRDAVFDARSPNDFVVAGSNDGITWVSVYDTAGSITWTDEIPRSFIVPSSSTAYQYYRLITKVCGNTGTTGRTSVIITEWTLNEVFVSIGNLYGSYAVNGDKSIRLPNISTTTSLNSSVFQVGSLPIRTVSMWVYVVGLISGYQYFLDARSGAPNGYISINAGSGDIGSDWLNGTYYVDGGSATTLTNTNFYNTINGNLNRWMHLTFVANATYTDDPCFFGRFTQLEGVNCTFRSILIYNRAITQSENTQNYNSYFGTHWVAGGDSAAGHTLAWSSDGFFWTGLGTTIFSSNCFGIGWNGKMWVAVGFGATNSIATSTDGKVWTARGYPAGITVGRRITWTGAYWVFAGEGANTLALSYDGIDWIPIIAPNTAVFGTRALGVGSNFSINDS